MAKDKRQRPNKLDAEFDLDSVLDLSDLDFGDPSIKDDRKPVVKAALGAAKGIAKLPRDSAFLKKTLKAALPRGYGQSWDTADQAASSLRNLYDESAKEIKPAIRESKKAIAKLIPRESKLVPKGILKMMDKWDEEAKREARNRTPSAFEQREDGLSQQMAQIFRAQTEMSVNAQAEADGRDRLKEGMALTRHREVAELLMRSTISLDKIQKYQSSVTLGYQKKSLELQFRNLFALQDMLTFMKEDGAKRDAILLAISKNTTLPDAVKINSKEAKEAIARNAWNQSVHQGLFGGRDQLVQRTLGKLSGMVLDNVRQGAQGIQMGLGMLDGPPMPGDKYDMGGQFAGGYIGEQLGQWGAGKLKGALRSGRLDRYGGQKILKAGTRLENAHANMAQRMQAFKNDNQYLFEMGPKGTALRFLQSLMPDMMPDRSVKIRGNKDLDEPATFTHRTARAVTDVIPGYLARILREVQVQRTGNKNIQLTTYSYSSGKFTSQGKAESAMLREIVNARGAKRTAGQLESMLREIDPEGKLSSEAREELKRKLLSNSLNLKEANSVNLALPSGYSDKGGAEIVPHMNKYLAGLSDEQRLAFSRSANSLGQWMRDPREEIQRQADWGNQAFLKKHGLLDSTGRGVNMEKVIELMLNPSFQAEGIASGPQRKQRTAAQEFASFAQGAFGAAAQKGKEGIMAGTSKIASMVPQEVAQATKQYGVMAVSAARKVVTDVYVAGEASPRLMAVKMQMGAYRDRVTKRIIQSVYDIAGPVEDVTEKGLVVLEQKDLPKLTMVTAQGALEKVKTAATTGQAKAITMMGGIPTNINDMSAMIMAKGKQTLEEAKAIADVYVEGESAPRLLATKLAQGLYRDAETGDALHHQTDIKGEVKDEAGQTVISAQDVPKLRVWNSRTKRFSPFLSGVGWIMKKMWNFQVAMTKWSMWNVKQLWRGTKAIGRGVKSLLGYGPKVPKDVYVQGEAQPRLYAARFKAGDYRDQETGERIYHHDDITGPVIDRENEVVLTQEDVGRLQVYDNILKVFNPLKLVKWVFKKGAALLGKAAMTWQTKIAPAITKRIFGAMGAAVKYFSRPKDVYVRGERTPRLRAVIMAAGGYISAKTRKLISTVADIDGAVLDETGNVALSDDEVIRGLENADGTPLQGGIRGAVGKGLSALNKLMSVRVKLPLAQRDQSTASVLKNKAATAGEKTVVLLEDIRDIFKKRFGGFGDSDGDGLRDGSWQARARDKAKELGQAITGKAGEKDGKTAGLGAITGLLGKLFGRKKGDKDKDEDGYGIRDALEDASNADDLLGRRGRRAGKLGRLAKWGKWGKTLGLGAAAAGAGYLADGAFGKFGVGKGPAPDQSQDDANWNNMSGGEKVASGLQRGIEKAGSFMFLGNLSKEAAASRQAKETEYLQGKAAGKPSKGLLDYLAMGTPFLAPFTVLNMMGSSAKTTAFDQLRYVQYGFAPDNKDAQEKASQTEDYIVSLTSPDMKVNEEKLDMAKIMGFWGLSSKDPSMQQKFFGWYKERFKPVLLTHLAAVKRFLGKLDLRAVSGLKKEQHAAYVEAVSYLNGPYNWRGLPQSGNSWSATGPSAVKSAVDKAIKDLGAKPGDAKVAEGAAAATAAAASATAKDDGGEKITGGEKKFTFKTFAGEAKKSVEAAAATSGIGKEAFATRRGVSGLQAVRFKVYGLKDMDAFKVNSVVMLESFVSPGVKFGGDGTASWDGDMNAVFAKAQTYFGIGQSEGQQASEWKVWFKNRFLPTYLAYASSVQNLTGKPATSDDAALKPADKVTVAKMLVGISGIWRQSESAWPDYKLGSDDSVTKDNIIGLEAKAKEAKLQEEKAGSGAVKPQDKSLWDKTTDTIKGWFGAKPTTQKDLAASKPTSPDAEAPSKGGPAGVSPVAVQGSGGGAQTPALAGGELSDGRNAAASMTLKPGVSLEGMHPEFMKNFNGMVEEYNKLTGKKVSINDAFRSFQKQAEMKKKYGARAAAPGSSLHEYGLAMDIDTKTLDELDKLGLMRKYGFTRPVGGEGWHMEPIGIQQDIARFKKDQQAAQSAIASGIGRGGGGFGTVDGAPKYSRNNALAMSIYSNASAPNVDNNNRDANGQLQAPNAPGQQTAAQALGNQGGSPSVMGNAGQGGALGVQGGVGASQDGETKPSDGGAQAPAGQTNTSGITSRPTAMPADPSVKVPDPKGSGYAGMKDTIEAAAKMVGVDPDTLIRMAAIESGFNASAQAKTSSASGLFQFTKDTWRAMIDKYGRKYGYSANTPTTDPKASAIMAAHMLKDSTQFVSGKVKRQFGPTEAYMTHFLGQGGAVRFLQAMESNPAAIAAQVMPKAAQANQSIFYDNGRPRTLQEVYAVLDNKVNSKLTQFGIPNIQKNNQALAAKAPTDTDTGSAAMPAAPTATGSPSAPASQPVQAPDAQPAAVNDAYGFKAPQAMARVQPQGQPEQMSASVMKPTEDILSQQLEQQKLMVGLLQQLVQNGGLAKAAQVAPAQDPNATPPASKTEYVTPKAPVQMKRVVV